MIKGESVSQKCIRKFFRQVMGKNMILNGNVIPIGIQNFSFVIHGVDTMAKYVQFGDMVFKFLGKVIPFVMQGQPALPDGAYR